MAEECVKTTAIPPLKYSLGSAGTSLREALVSTLKRIDEIEEEIVSLARKSVNPSLSTSDAGATDSTGLTEDMVKGLGGPFQPVCPSGFFSKIL